MRVVIAGDYPEHPPDLVGGIQAVIYNTLEHLANYPDLDLHIVTCEKWRTRPLSPPTDRQGRWSVHYLPSSPRLPHTLSMLTVDRVAVRRQIRALAPDLVHAHGQAAAYPFAAFDTGLPTLVTVHGINALEARVDPRGGALKGRLRFALWNAVERLCLRRAQDIVVISPFVEQIIGANTRARLHVVENPVQDDFLSLVPEPQPGKVLLVGSVQKRKGTLEAVQAMALVHRQVPGAQLYVAGGFSPAYQAYGDRVRRHVAETGAEGYVRFMGHLGHAALLEAYRTSHLVLFPSWLEASPVALEEAMAAGLPSVVSDIGGTAHLVEEGVTGFRVPVGSAESLAEAMLHLLQDAGACQRMGQRARQIAASRFSAELAARKTHDLYQGLLRPGPVAGAAGPRS
jgi:glycosyltransferase involved in cell wall biosynthesis